jgi:glyoxylase-like metal-dependent hydrolase (beta-lactamase superfamily II)
VPEAPSEVAPGVHRLGSALVSFYLVEDAGRFTLVDAGLPGFFDQLPRALGHLGADLHDVEAVVLTHAHPDHIGIAERVRTEAQARIHVHASDAQMARTATVPNGIGSLLPYIRRPAAWRFVGHTTRYGAARTPRVEDVTTFADGAVLDVPGRPAVIATPGHSHGHCALLLADRGVLLAGDALCSRNPLTGRHGPQIMPAAFNASTAQALQSLERLDGVAARIVLFGHGEPWTRGLEAALAAARGLGPS